MNALALALAQIQVLGIETQNNDCLPTSASILSHMYNFIYAFLSVGSPC